MFAGIITHFASLTLIKLTNAMNKVMLACLKTVSMWCFFLVWPFEGNEHWSNIKCLGMVILIMATFFYIKLD